VKSKWLNYVVPNLRRNKTVNELTKLPHRNYILQPKLISIFHTSNIFSKHDCILLLLKKNKRTNKIKRKVTYGYTSENSKRKLSYIQTFSLNKKGKPNNTH
jgi:hypothetical protein